MSARSAAADIDHAAPATLQGVSTLFVMTSGQTADTADLRRRGLPQALVAG
jgi:hypothetical protein